MISEICAYLKNYFVNSKDDVIVGEFTIENGEIHIPQAKVGQYIRIQGSTFNDGVFPANTKNLTDEVFSGAVWLMHCPKDFIDIVDEIKEWQDKYFAVVSSPYQSESFGNYSYSMKSSAANGEDGRQTTWQSVFKDRLRRWRKI